MKRPDGLCNFYTVVRAPGTRQFDVLRVTRINHRRRYGRIGHGKELEFRPKLCHGDFSDFDSARNLAYRLREIDAAHRPMIEAAAQRHDILKSQFVQAINLVVNETELA